jgi:2,4-dienoyl-CoA reductase-like NADH-dependent reductase (Old Yellow Enzyme family)/NADPH-dependent 2,4-dienoyl-CoA reductase/sulfur reductase-like enzyme
MLNHLFNSFDMKGKIIKNRTVVAPMVMNLCNKDGTCTERFTAYHEAKARGGFGMIITEDFAVMPNGKGFVGIPGLWHDDQIPGFKAFTDRIHKAGAVIIAQIYHCGRQTTEAICGTQPWAPSADPCPLDWEIPHEMTSDEIHQVIEAFGDCARRAETAGFDGIELHGAHGYLLAQFLSPYSNQRTDTYGGPLENRLRFPLEVIQDVRSKVSDRFIVGYRISGDEHVSGGRTIEDTKTIVPYLEQAGIDYVHVTAGCYGAVNALCPSMYTRHAWIADDAAAVKEVTDLPVISVGRYNDMRIADEVLGCGKADLIAFGRASLCDPEAPNKAKTGQFEDIITCIGCEQGCLGGIYKQEAGQCILNPFTANEFNTPAVIPAASRKKVMIAGAGPAGLAAAIEAAKAGHHVSVYEKRRWAGGQFRLGSVPPSKGEIANYSVWQLHQLTKLGVDVQFNTTVTKALVESIHPDVVVVATGGTAIIPDKIPGINNAIVCTSHDILEGKALGGVRNIVIGGGSVGCETANYLASSHKKVTIVEMLDDIAIDEETAPRWDLLEELKKHNVRVLTESTVSEIKEDAVVVTGRTNETIKVDRVILAVGAQPVNTLADALKDTDIQVEVIGDATATGLAGKAIREGFDLGRSL